MRESDISSSSKWDFVNFFVIYPFTSLCSFVVIASLIFYMSFHSSTNSKHGIFYSNNDHPASPSSCLGPPYLYATTHHEIPNVIKYSRNGCLLSTEVLVGGPFINITRREPRLRNVVIGSYKDKEDILYVAEIIGSKSAVSIYGSCKRDQDVAPAPAESNTNKKNGKATKKDKGERRFLTTLITSDQNQGASHPFGITFDKNKNIFISFQKTDLILGFRKDTFQPLPMPSALNRPPLGLNDDGVKYFPATFFQFGSVGSHPLSEQGIRSMEVVNDDLWVANEDINGVAVIQLSTGFISNIIVINDPTDVFYEKSRNLVFIGSKQKHWNGAIYAVDPTTLRIVKTYTTNRMDHPSGIVADKDVLYVAEQDLGFIFTFNIESGKFIQTIVNETPGQIEGLALSDC
jgi:hypothetical protein